MLGDLYLFIFNLLQVNRRSSVFSVEFESRDERPNEAVGSGYYKPCWRNLDFTYLIATKLHSFDVFFCHVMSKHLRMGEWGLLIMRAS